MNMLHDVRRMFYAILDVGFDSSIHFLFDLRKGQGHLKFQNSTFSYKTCLSSPVLSQNSTNVIYF